MCLTVWEILVSAKNFIKDNWHGNKMQVDCVCMCECTPVWKAWNVFEQLYSKASQSASFWPIVSLAGNIQMPHRPRLMWSSLHPLSARLTQSRRLKRTMVFNEATAKNQDFPSNNLRRIVLERLLGHKVLKLLCEFLLQITMVYCYHDAQRSITTDGGKTQETKTFVPFSFQADLRFYPLLSSPVFKCVFFPR